ncbi:helix-turn-helix domain-containing protein [Denitromonas iodatirespirans]|uniref:Helix-turn-helix transcriptional regulator n=1 Tax=Denitromonas iodatirespirans TaxID=2795389 RepID=A0A944DAT9_DENI1|nr:AraC family transcriptional regulator [Denitromonas iodatirespirans]MBT0961611.1 helix-turn-helix transcriptional regulator [Denitromonas iodatirespirans]
MDAQPIAYGVTHRLPARARAADGEARAAAGAVARVKQFIEDNFREPISLDGLAALVGLTRFSLAKHFRQRVGVSPYRYVCEVRVRHAKRMMTQGCRPTDVASAVGFFDQSHLARHFKRACGMTPREYMSRQVRPRPKSSHAPMD